MTAPKVLDVPIGLHGIGMRRESDSLGDVDVPADHAIDHDLTLKQAALDNGVSEELFDRVVNPLALTAPARPTFNGGSRT